MVPEAIWKRSEMASGFGHGFLGVDTPMGEGVLSLEPDCRVRGGAGKLESKTDSVQAIVEAVGFWAQGADGGASA